MTTRVLPLGGSTQNDVAFVEIYTRPLEAAQSLDATRLHFDLATHAIVKSRLPDARTSLYVFKHGSFQSADAAYEARGAEDCLGPLGVFPAALLPGLELPAFFLGLVLVRREDAALPFSDATCAAIKAETLEYRPKR
jgi:hypothetical protein